MNQCISKDGSSIAFDQEGDGPALILVLGAFNDRRTGAPLARRLSSHFHVFINHRLRATRLVHANHRNHSLAPSVLFRRAPPLPRREHIE